MTDWQEILIPIISAIATCLGSWLVAVVTKWINTKIKDKSTADMLTSLLAIVTDAVKTVYQTYVESLKDAGTFDATAQAEAKAKATALISSKLTDDMKSYLTEHYGTADAYVSEAIEKAIYDCKNK